MLTQCPGCQTVFRITGTILRAAHGQVRCGRCNKQFDAIEHLAEGDEFAEAPAENNSAVAESRSASEATEFLPSAFDRAAASHEEITMEGDRINIDEFIAKQNAAAAADLDDDEDASIIEEFNVLSAEWQNPFKKADVDAATAASFDAALSSLDQVLPEDRSTELTRLRTTASVTDDRDIANAIDAFNESVYLAEQNLADDAVSDSPSEPEEEQGQNHAERTRMRRWHKRERKPKHAPLSQLGIEPEPFTVTSTTRRWPWVLTSIALTLLLSLQILHHYRQTLVRHPGFGSTLKTVYASFGVRLEPRWELNAYAIKQWGIVSDPQVPGVLRVRASITNNAGFAQPYPLLKLALEDRFGSTLGTREFTPDEYLPSAASATRLLDAGVAANVDLAIVDPGDEAVGFQFDTCLRDGSATRCAHDL